MENENGIVHALQLDGKGGAVKLAPAAIPAALAKENLVWVHLDLGRPGSREWLQRHIRFPDDSVPDALLAQETRPRLLTYDKGALIILRGVNLNENAQPEDMVSIRMWVYENNIISLRLRTLKAVIDIQDRLLAGHGPGSTGEFVTSLITRLFERMEPVLAALDEALDKLEQQIMEEPDPEDRYAITGLRRRAILFKRYISPQRDVIASLRNTEQNWLTGGDRRRLLETLDRVVRYLEDLDATRERGQIIKDELANALTDRMNKNLYRLSVIAAIFLPLGFLTGLLGINVGGIPGADAADAFLIFCAILLGVVAGQILLFRFLKWF